MKKNCIKKKKLKKKKLSISVWIVIVKCGAVLGDLLYDPSLPMANV
jgi:hypothetical protein